MRAYIVMRLLAELPTGIGGLKMRAANDGQGLLGVCPVFKSKKAARDIFGPLCDPHEVNIPKTAKVKP